MALYKVLCTKCVYFKIHTNNFLKQLVCLGEVNLVRSGEKGGE